MRQRLKGIGIIAPITIGFFLGSSISSIIALALGAVIYYELHQAFAKKDIHIQYSFGVIAIIILGAISFQVSNVHYVMAAAAIAGIVSVCVQEKIKIKNILMSVFCALYAFLPYWLMSLLHYVFNDYIGDIVTSLIFTTAFATDISAMLVGHRFGKHKLSKISPNKTIEGSIGGIIGALIAFCIWALYWQTGLSAVEFVPLVIVGSVSAQAGDLFASYIKRKCGIKDYSNFLPGHGGFLDRFDSVSFASFTLWVGFLLCFYLA